MNVRFAVRLGLADQDQQRGHRIPGHGRHAQGLAGCSALTCSRHDHGTAQAHRFQPLPQRFQILGPAFPKSPAGRLAARGGELQPAVRLAAHEQAAVTAFGQKPGLRRDMGEQGIEGSRLHLRHREKALHPGFAGAHLLLFAPAVRDVAEKHQSAIVSVPIHRHGRHIGDELPPVQAQHGMLAHGHRKPVLVETTDAGQDLVAVRRRDPFQHGRAEQPARNRHAEEFSRPGINVGEDAPRLHEDAERGVFHQQAETLFACDQATERLLAVGDVHDDGIEQDAVVKPDRAGIDVHVAHAAVGEPVPELEGAFAATLGFRHGRADLMGRPRVDVRHAPLPDLLARPAVVGAGRRVGVSDGSRFGIDQQHGGMVVLEKALIARFALDKAGKQAVARQAAYQQQSQRDRKRRIQGEHRQGHHFQRFAGDGKRQQEGAGQHEDVEHDAERQEIPRGKPGQLPDAPTPPGQAATTGNDRRGQAHVHPEAALDQAQRRGHDHGHDRGQDTEEKAGHAEENGSGIEEQARPQLPGVEHHGHGHAAEAQSGQDALSPGRVTDFRPREGIVEKRQSEEQGGVVDQS